MPHTLVFAGLVVLAAVLGGVSLPAQAQDSRTAVIAAEQGEKATRLAPRIPSRAENLFLTAMEVLVETPEGLYPYFGSVYSGGGFTLGAGLRRFTGDRTNWNVAGLYSLKQYKLIEVSVVSPGHAAGRVSVSTRAGWRDATQVPYHGTGIESQADGFAAFRFQENYAGGDITLHPRRWLPVFAGATYEHYTLKPPVGSRPAVDDIFTSDTAPGLGENPAYLHTTTGAALDWRPAAGYARRGGRYGAAYHHYADPEESLSFNRLDAEAIQHVPIARENWVVSVRGQLQTTLGDDDQVPYFLLPSLGSGDTLRGYSSWRFRDRHSVLLSGEFRWIVNRLGVDMAVFYDAGTVSPTFDQISLSNMVSDYGVGLRFHGPTHTALRIELARGREGTRLVFAAGPAF